MDEATMPFFVATSTTATTGPSDPSSGGAIRVMERSTSTMTTTAIETGGTIVDDCDDEFDYVDDYYDDENYDVGAASEGGKGRRRTDDVDLLSLIGIVLKNEGVSGFFGGVKAMMIGQALIKSVAFSANELALGVLTDVNNNGAVESLASGLVDDGSGGGAIVATTPFVTLILAAGFSGFVTSFLVAPVGERDVFPSYFSRKHTHTHTHTHTRAAWGAYHSHSFLSFSFYHS
jgi:hypothetical protein